MKDKKYLKMLIAIFAVFLPGIYYCIVLTPLGYIYGSFPGQESLVNLVVSLPGIAAMIGGFAVAGLVEKTGNKFIVMFSLILGVVGSLLVRFMGPSSLVLTIVGVSLTGLMAGIIPSAGYTALAAISPEYFRDKVCGWSGIFTSVGFVLFNLFASFASNGGAWEKAFNAGFLLLIVVVIGAIWYPSTKTIKEAEKTNLAGTAEVTADNESIKSYMPKSIIALIIIKFVSALFYMGMNNVSSDYAINELGTGSSVIAGNAYTLNTAVGLLLLAVLFKWLKRFKGASSMMALIEMGVSCFIILLIPNVWGFFIGYSLQAIGMNANHNGMGTVASMAPKGRAVAIASGCFVAATYVGEALSIYVCPFLSRTILGNANPSGAILVSAVGSIVIGIISWPFFRSAYKDAFPNGQPD